MKTLFLECNMGAAGDMLLASLSELLPAPDQFMDDLKTLGLPGVAISRTYASSAGIRGARVQVLVNGEEERSKDVPPTGVSVEQKDHCHHHDDGRIGEDGAENTSHSHSRHHRHTSMAKIRQLIAGLPVSGKVQDDVLAVYRLIADAESQAHGCPVEEIHFHEVGTMDALTDITGVSLLMEKIGAEKIYCSPINVGSGAVRCAHGILPVPTPATAAILKGVPCYGSTFPGELCTPTGAALLKHFVSGFGPMPQMSTEKIGVGIGAKEFPAANILRTFLGNTAAEMASVEELSCNLDDCTGEEIGFAFELLLEHGALDVFLTPIQMKKSRPGTLVTVISKPEDAEKLTALLLRHTTTLGVRRKICSRTRIHRFVETRETPFGPVRVKIGENDDLRKSKIEYEDAAAIALAQGIPLRDVQKGFW